MSRLQDDSSCKQQNVLTVRPPTSQIDDRVQKNEIIRQTGFFSLPIEIRNIIYGYVFHGAVLRVGKHGVDIEKSRAHCEILQSCRAVIDEATTVLFSTATQLFQNKPYEMEPILEPNLNLRPIHPELVPGLRVVCHQPNNFVRLNMGALRTYTCLRRLELGVFMGIWFEKAPNRVVKQDAVTVNEANDSYIVIELKKALVDKIQYRHMIFKPLCLQALRGILNSKNRRFRVLLRCEVAMACNDGGDYDGVRVLLDWDNEELLEKRTGKRTTVGTETLSNVY